MKLEAFTIIEGIISMVILSLLLSVGGMISFNLYRSLPKNENVKMKGILTSQLDSLTDLGITESQKYVFGTYQIDFAVEEWNETERLYMATITLTDSLQRTETMERVFLSYED